MGEEREENAKKEVDKAKAEKAKAEAGVEKAETKAEEQEKTISELRAQLDKKSETASASSGEPSEKEGGGGEDVTPASV